MKIGYADNFSVAPANPTYAYPTMLTDPANNSSTVQYRYDIGANVWAQSPAPAGNTQGKISEREYDSFGRLVRDKIVNLGGAYTRYEYPANGVQSKVYSTIIDTNGNGADTADEVLSESWADGAGRVLRSRTEHPGSVGGWSGSISGDYPSSGPDATSYGRCAEGGVPMPCDPQSRISMNFDRIQDAINKDNETPPAAPSHGSSQPESPYKADDAKRGSEAAQTTTETDKPEPDPETPGTVDTASVPCVDGVDDEDVVTVCTSEARETREPRIGGGADASESSSVTSSPLNPPGPRAKWELEKFKSCLRDNFKTELGLDDGRSQAFNDKHFVGFFGAGKTPFTIDFDYSQTRADIKKSINTAATGYAEGNFSMKVYIASDLSKWDDLATRVHEVGNKIYAAKMGPVGFAQPTASKALNDKLKRIPPGLDDFDAGMALEECVFGGRVRSDGTLIK